MHVHVNMYVFTSEKSKYIHILFMRICEYIYRSLPFTVYICTCVCNYSCVDRNVHHSSSVIIRASVYVYLPLPCDIVYTCMCVCNYSCVYVQKCSPLPFHDYMSKCVYIHVCFQVFLYRCPSIIVNMYMCVCMYSCVYVSSSISVSSVYDVATTSRLLRITGLFCRISSLC